MTFRKPYEVTMEESAPFHQRALVRTVHPLDVTQSGLPVELSRRVRVGDSVAVLRYASDRWDRLVEVQDAVRVAAVDGKSITLHATMPRMLGAVVATGFETEAIGSRVAVRFDGREVARFNSSGEADEYVARNGMDVRAVGNRAMVTHLGEDVQEFETARDAWAYVAGIINR